MKRDFFCILIALLTLPVFAQRQTQAKLVLERTVSAFEKAGGVRANFTVEVFHKDRSVGLTTGTIELKGEKFFLKTAESLSWFDGKTQWSYLVGSDEVNISTPTEVELQSLNPYALLYLYKKGFSYKLGEQKSFRGKPIDEVVLTATDPKKELLRIVLYVAKTSYQPLYILIEQRDRSRSEIIVTEYRTGLKIADSKFVFNKKQYPTAEVIDLR